MDIDNIPFDQIKDPREAWNTYAARKVLADANYTWLCNAKHWINFVTLTFREEISKEAAYKKFKLLLRALNTRLLGEHYCLKVHHSYFSYILGTEYQLRGVIHFHMLVDKPIDYQFIHDYWKDIAGISLYRTNK